MGIVNTRLALGMLVAMSGGCGLPMLPAFDTLAASGSAPRGEPVNIALDRSFAVGDMLTMEVVCSRTATEGPSFGHMDAEESESGSLRVRVAVLAVDASRAPTMVDLRFERATRGGAAEIEGKFGPERRAWIPAIAPGALARAVVLNGEWALQQMQGRAPTEQEQRFASSVFAYGALDVLAQSMFGDTSHRRVGEQWSVSMTRLPISGASGPLVNYTARLVSRGTNAQADVVRLRGSMITPVLSNNLEGLSQVNRRTQFERELLTPVDREHLPLQLLERVTVDVVGYTFPTTGPDGARWYSGRAARVVQEVRVRYFDWVRARPVHDTPLRREGVSDGDGVATKG